MYINKTNLQYPLSEQDIRLAHPNTSFAYPFQPPEEYEYVFPTPTPTYDNIVQVVYEVAPELTTKGHWEQRWEVRPKFVEYTQDGVVITVAEQEGAARVVAAQLAQQQLLQQFDQALTNHLDNTAKDKRYDGRISCALRAGYAGPFQAEGQAFAQWMDTCNYQAYQTMAAVLSGDQVQPTIDEFIASLPKMVWPT